MKKHSCATLTVFALIGLQLMGCGKENGSGNLPSAAKQGSDPTPAMQPLLSEWQQGDKSAAIRRFVETDWSARPLFSTTSPLSLTEEQFKALSASDRETKSGEIMSQAGVLKQLAAAVAQAGLDASAKKDMVQARKHFTSLKRCGEALDSPTTLAIIKLVGQGIRKRADTELAKLGQ